MNSSPNTALEAIQRDLLAGDVPVTRTLQKVILLGGQIDSTDLRTWARRELDGYGPDDVLPAHRKIGAPMYMDYTNGNGIWKGVTVPADDLPEGAKEAGIGNEVRIPHPLAEIEHLAARDDFVRLSVPAGDVIARVMTRDLRPNNPFLSIERVYYSASTASLLGVVEGVRTALSDLVSELVRTMPADRTAPTKDEADRAVQYLFTGNHGPVTVTAATAAEGAAINTSNATSTGAGASTSSASSAVGHVEPEKPEGWWTRTRKRGAVLALIGACGATAGVMNWLGWHPFV